MPRRLLLVAAELAAHNCALHLPLSTVYDMPEKPKEFFQSTPYQIMTDSNGQRFVCYLPPKEPPTQPAVQVGCWRCWDRQTSWHQQMLLHGVLPDWCPYLGALMLPLTGHMIHVADHAHRT